MTLLWLQYSGKKSSRYILLLFLGHKSGKYCGLDADSISEDDVKEIKRHSTTLKAMGLAGRLTWLRKHCPITYRHCYRELPIKNCVIQRKYNWPK